MGLKIGSSLSHLYILNIWNIRWQVSYTGNINVFVNRKPSDYPGYFKSYLTTLFFWRLLYLLWNCFQFPWLEELLLPPLRVLAGLWSSFSSCLFILFIYLLIRLPFSIKEQKSWHIMENLVTKICSLFIYFNTISAYKIIHYSLVFALFSFLLFC